MIGGRRINLWAVERADLIQNYSWANDPEIVRLTGMTPFPKSSWEIERWLESIQGNPGINTYSIKLNDGTYIGNIEISHIDWRSLNGEVGIMIGGKGNRGKGYGHEAIQILDKFAFEEMNLHRLYARILPFNRAAIKAFEKCGYTKEGEERDGHFAGGKYWNVLIYSLLRDEYFGKFGEKAGEI